MDDTVLVTDSDDKLCRLLNEFTRVSERRKSRVNVRKIMHYSKYENVGQINIKLNSKL